MAVFTYIATAIVTYVTGAAVVAGTWAAFAVSVIATGLAAVTARLLGVGSRGSNTGGQDQGVRIQLPPATENKIPVIYGHAWQQGIITDARISNENKTMTYVITLSEKTQTGSWTAGDIYWNDQRLVFKADGFTVDYAVTSDNETNNNLNGLVRAWVYAGGSSSTYQIKGPTTPVAAYSIIPNTTSSYAMSDLVFAVMQLDYNNEKGVTGLPTMTFELTNSLKNPGLVWYDYMTSDRYGGGFDVNEVNSWTSIAAANTFSVYSISETIPTNQFVRWPANSATTTLSTLTSQVRYEINGVLSTGDTIKTNLEKLNLASASYTTYDHKTAEWKLIPNRAVTGTELTSTFLFTDDNIIGDISLTATNLEDLYNQLEVSYPNKNTRDQSDYYKFNLDSSLLNQLEPPNQLRINAAMVNNYIHAGRIGQIELLASRSDLLISFQADYSALQVEAGDVVRVSNSCYGFVEKPFRVTRVRETEGEDASLVSEIVAIEYSDSVYEDNTLTDMTFLGASGIPFAAGSAALPSPSAPTTSTINYNLFTIQSTVNNASYPVDAMEFFYATSSTGQFSFITSTPASGQFYANDVVTGTINSLPQGTYYFKARTRKGSNYSNLSSTSTAFAWSPTYDFGTG